jgi:predicted acylesterase/phospholipase RssA
VALFSTALFLLVIQGCITPKRLPAVPDPLTMTAIIPGIPEARFWVTSRQGIDDMIKYTLETRSRQKRELSRIGHQGPLPPLNFLAISGGGDRGSFGAGLLVGWTEAGNRPYFHVVTGVSTGALLAPFAYLGPEYDQTLKTIYKNIGPDDIFKKRFLLDALFDDALRDSTPLWQLVEKNVNEELLKRVAEKHNKGPSLLVATTNLDARLPVVWNMGEIAASGDPKSLELFRKILLASSSIPGVFPPVMIDVEVDGVSYQEMHVDGGATAQVYLFPTSLGNTIRDKGLWIERERTAYIIRNARLDPDWASIDRRTLSILGRAISSLTQTQGVGDLYQIYLNARHNNMDFNLAFIDPDFDVEHKEEFDTEYMRALFDYAYQLAREGYPWQKTPPGLLDTDLEVE